MTDAEIMEIYWAAHAQFGPFKITPQEHLALVRKQEARLERERQGAWTHIPILSTRIGILDNPEYTRLLNESDTAPKRIVK